MKWNAFADQLCLKERDGKLKKAKELACCLPTNSSRENLPASVQKSLICTMHPTSKPTLRADCLLENQRTLRLITLTLDRICNTNRELRDDCPTPFDAVAIPAMPLVAYVARLRRYTKLDFVCFLVALTYMDQLCQQDGAFCPTLHNIHRLLVTSLLVASKAAGERRHDNKFMSMCGGITAGELSKLEVELCCRLGWALLPSMTQLHKLRDALEMSMRIIGPGG